MNSLYYALWEISCFRKRLLLVWSDNSAVVLDIHTHLLVWLRGSLVRDEALTVPLAGRERRPRADWVSWGISPRPWNNPQTPGQLTAGPLTKTLQCENTKRNRCFTFVFRVKTVSLTVGKSLAGMYFSRILSKSGWDDRDSSIRRPKYLWMEPLC